MLEWETLKWFKPAKVQISTGFDTAALSALRLPGWRPRRR